MLLRLHRRTRRQWFRTGRVVQMRPARPRWYRAWLLTLWSVLGLAGTLAAWGVSGMLTGR